MGKLNDKLIRAEKVSSGEKFLTDGDGLCLRIRPGDSLKTWFYRYTMNGQARKIQLGVYPDMGLAEARSRAAPMTGKRRQGIDPIAEAEAAEAAARLEAEKAARELAKLASRITVGVLFNRWAAVDLVRHRDGGAYVKDQMNRHVLPIIGDLVAEDVRKGHITQVTDKLLSAGKDRTAKVAFSQMRQMFRFAVDRDILDADPTATIRKAKIGGKDTERDRVLSEAEIRELSAKIADARLLPSTEAAVWIALSTACRIGELLTARWVDVNFETRVWNIGHTKNGKPHAVFLSNFAVAQFKAIKADAESKQARDQEAGRTVKPLEFVFPDRSDSKPVCVKTITKQLSDRQKIAAPGDDEAKPMSRRSNKVDALLLPGGQWRPHDLRRTAATLMVSLGVLPEVAERCLNHVEENKVKRIYQRHSYEAEMRQAWALLGDRRACPEFCVNGVWVKGCSSGLRTG